MMNNLTLSELARLHQQIRPKLMTMGFVGEVEAKLVNADGSVDQVVKQKNAATTWLNKLWQVANDRNETSMEVAIANDDGWPMHPWKSLLVNNYTTDSQQVDDRSLDSANLIWTFQTTFSAPAADRIFRYVALGFQASDAAVASSPYYTQHLYNIIAATRLTAQLTQTTTQTLEITYRLAWQRA